jgi:hypothetical protein
MLADIADVRLIHSNAILRRKRRGGKGPVLHLPSSLSLSLSLSLSFFLSFLALIEISSLFSLLDPAASCV